MYNIKVGSKQMAYSSSRDNESSTGRHGQGYIMLDVERCVALSVSLSLWSFLS